MPAAKQEQQQDQQLAQGEAAQEAKLERRIVELLSLTRLTFKQIVNRLQAEQLSVSIGHIRRINRDNRFRRPRYDSKLSREQRALLLDELVRQCAGGTMRPNLSQLAKQFGVCHGSIWYWWDKLNKGSQVSGGGGGGASSGRRARGARSARLPRRRPSLASLEPGGATPTSSQSQLEPLVIGQQQQQQQQHFSSFHTIGRVEVSVRGGTLAAALGQTAADALQAAAPAGQLLALPILMLARRRNPDTSGHAA